MQANPGKLDACFSDVMNISAEVIQRVRNAPLAASVGRRARRGRCQSLAAGCTGGASERLSSASDEAEARAGRALPRGSEQSTARAKAVQMNQCVVTPLALSHGCGLIALYTSPYLTPAG